MSEKSLCFQRILGTVDRLIANDNSDAWADLPVEQQQQTALEVLESIQSASATMANSIVDGKFDLRRDNVSEFLRFRRHKKMSYFLSGRSDSDRGRSGDSNTRLPKVSAACNSRRHTRQCAAAGGGMKQIKQLFRDSLSFADSQRKARSRRSAAGGG